jgi:hypothetical protein
MKPSALILAALAFTAISCMERGYNAQTKIVRGSLVEESDAIYKTTVSLDTNTKPFCSGAIFDRRTIITAAHCIKGAPPGGYAVTVGSGRSTIKKSIPFQRNQAAMHPDWSGSDMGSNNIDPLPTSPKNDIAVVVLSEDLPEWVKPAPIKLIGPVTPGDHVLLAGFGQTRMQDTTGINTQMEFSGLLRSTEAALESVNERGLEFIYRPLAEQHNGTSCHGDSGGPMFFKEADGTITLIGITSRSYSKAEDCDGRGVYTDVRKFDGWIRSKREELLKAAGPSPDEWQHRYFDGADGTKIALDYQLSPMGQDKAARVVWVNISNPTFTGTETIEVEINSYISSLLKQKATATYAGEQRFTVRLGEFEGKAVCSPTSRWGIKQDIAVRKNGTPVKPANSAEPLFPFLFCQP